MAVIFGCQPKMATALSGILGLLHGTKGQAADLWFIWKSLNALQNVLDLLRGNLLARLLHRHALIVKKGEKTLYLLRIRSLMGTVNKRHIVSAALFCHCLVCHEHEILNDRTECSRTGIFFQRFSCNRAKCIIIKFQFHLVEFEQSLILLQDRIFRFF